MDWISFVNSHFGKCNGYMVRRIHKNELTNLLELYQHLHPDDTPLELTGEVEQLWDAILEDPKLNYFVAEMNGQIVSSCTLAVVPNLTRAARPYGLIENVVTHPDNRCRGFGTQVLQFALAHAWDQGCYKVMLMTGRKDAATLRFYQNAGFTSEEKTGFVAKPSD